MPCLIDAKISLVPKYQLIVPSTLLALATNIRRYKATNAQLRRQEKKKKKRNQVSLIYYSTVDSPWIIGESKLCYFSKLCSNTNSSKTWHSQDLTRTGASVSPLRTSWTRKLSCLSLPWIKINTRRNLAKFYKVSFVTKLVAMLL